MIKQNRNHKRQEERLIIETDRDTRQLLELKKKVAELERIIGQKQILIDFKDKIIELAEDPYGVDIKKVFHPTLEYFCQHREQYRCSTNKLSTSLNSHPEIF